MERPRVYKALPGERFLVVELLRDPVGEAGGDRCSRRSRLRRGGLRRDRCERGVAAVPVRTDVGVVDTRRQVTLRARGLMADAGAVGYTSEHPAVPPAYRPGPGASDRGSGASACGPQGQAFRGGFVLRARVVRIHVVQARPVLLVRGHRGGAVDPADARPCRDLPDELVAPDARIRWFVGGAGRSTGPVEPVGSVVLSVLSSLDVPGAGAESVPTAGWPAAGPAPLACVPFRPLPAAVPVPRNPPAR